MRNAIEAKDLRRSFVLPLAALGPRPTKFYVQGAPIVNFLTRAAIRIIEATSGVSAAAMRAETQPAHPSA